MSANFLVFEGIDGAGKSTQIGLLAGHLGKSHDVVVLQEPGGTSLGEAVRGLLLRPETGHLDPATEVFLFMAARSHLVRTEIRPALARGAVVICDRYVWSSVVYQGIVGGLGLEPVMRLGKLAVDGVMPARTFVLDLPVAAAWRRKADGRGADRIERKGRRFQESVRAGFLELARRYSRRIAVVDARGRPETVHRRILADLPRRLGGGRS